MKWSNLPGHLAKVVLLPTEVKDDDRERERHKFMPEFKKDAVALATEQDYSIAKAEHAVDTSENNLRRWNKELARLRRENKELRMEKEILFPLS